MVGDKLKKIREEKRFTKAALEEKSGVSRHTIRKIEAGECSPTTDTLDSLASALGVNTGLFFDNSVNLSLQREAR